MVRLSVNVNKIATLRNSRGGRMPSVVEAVDACIAAGARGITVHPRADQRHIMPDDVRKIADALVNRSHVELNIEGDPRPDLIELVREIRPSQCTLVPVLPGEITSQAGWRPGPGAERLPDVVASLRSAGIRVSLFVDALPRPIEWAASIGADRVELYTEPYARAFETGQAQALVAFDEYVRAARLAHAVGLGVNAGHDLDLENLVLFRTLPHLDEVSIGHALVSRAVFVGLSTVVREYLECLSQG
ncbi:MAG: pyridoxine 5'-phosphate synthase [Acidobacteriota bacterium]